jgi:hypothetical protein
LTIGRRALSLAIAGAALALSFSLSSTTGIYAVLIPFFLTPGLALAMAIRAALMRKAAVPAHPSARP